MGAQGKGIEVLEDKYALLPVRLLSLNISRGYIVVLQEFKYLKSTPVGSLLSPY